MLINNLRAKTLNTNTIVYNNKAASTLKSGHSYFKASNFIANILSKVFVLLYADLYSPLKNPSIS